RSTAPSATSSAASPSSRRRAEPPFKNATPARGGRFHHGRGSSDLDLVCCCHQVGNQVGGIRSAEAGDRIPAGARRIAGDARIDLVVADRDVVEVGGVLGRIGGDLVQGRVQ